MRPARLSSLVVLALVAVSVAACASDSAGWTYAPAPPITPPPSIEPSGSVEPTPAGSVTPSGQPSAPPAETASPSISAAPSDPAAPSGEVTSVEVIAAQIQWETDELTVPTGHLLTDQGQTGREAFIIVDGSATVKRNGKKVATLGPGSVVGELSLLDHGPRTATVTADSDTTVLVIEQRHFLGVLESVPTLARKLLASLAGRVREFDRQYYG